MFHYLKELIRCGSGVSSKSFFLVSVTIIGCFLILVTGFVLIYEVVTTGTINTDINGLAAYIGAISALFATAGVTKVWAEKYECQSRQTHTEETFDGTDENEEEA